MFQKAEIWGLGVAVSSALYFSCLATREALGCFKRGGFDLIL